ncbi:MAG: ligase-associated DNA damage response DEXH box helicase [Ferruginibacter sp.]|nr:ligase-associated DNA damage response DEXH box helicase [Cytophagales bacterium]
MPPTKRTREASPGYEAILRWFGDRGWQPFAFQQAAWQAYLAGKSGLLNAPTGSGKTFALWMPCLAEYINQYPPDYRQPRRNGLQILWITPLRALAKDIRLAMQTACDDLGVPWRVAVRTGNTSTSERQQQLRRMPECLVTTPESLHILLSQKGGADHFRSLKAVIIDEWHELLGSKRGVQAELALSRLRPLTRQPLKVWGISATIGNLEQALAVLTGADATTDEAAPGAAAPGVILRAEVRKQTRIHSVLPDDGQEMPYPGQLGTKLIAKILPVIRRSQTTLVFVNTRAAAEIWYQHLLLQAPELAGLVAMHHGSLDAATREWVEEALKEGRLKAVVCTSSLDLGVDFAPVETIVQVGSPKGVARFLQRAGRSGHRPGAVSQIYFLPTHSLELIEAVAMKEAATTQLTESRIPVPKPLDVLVQYLVTLAVGDGFEEGSLYQEVRGTYAYRDLSPEEWAWALAFITTGGQSLGAYDEFARVEITGEGRYQVTSRQTAMRHRLGIGTIVSDPSIRLQYLGGTRLGTLEESFVSRLREGDVFWFGGKNLEFVRVREMTAWVRRAGTRKGTVPRWSGQRMALSPQLAAIIRRKWGEIADNTDDIREKSPEIRVLAPLLDRQQRWSAIPRPEELLFEQLKTREGYHVFVYPFEGRLVNEVLAALCAYRLSRMQPISISIASNDYGFELLSDQEIPLEEALAQERLFQAAGLTEDIEASLNETEMARRRFRDIASIAGLIFQGYPGKNITSKHLQSSSQLLFDVFRQYDPHNLLLRQAYDEVLRTQLQESHLLDTLERLRGQRIILKKTAHPTPLAFPIMIERLREILSSEKLEDRIAKMQLQVTKW